MDEKANRFKPRKLIDPKVIKKKGYYDTEILKYIFENYRGKQKLTYYFKIIKGKHNGFTLSTSFYDTKPSNARLTYLCNSVGIFYELKDPNDLVGKKVKLRIVPKYSDYKGRTYLEHRITRFHHINRKF
jgi:hypothetical protein